MKLILNLVLFLFSFAFVNTNDCQPNNDALLKYYTKQFSFFENEMIIFHQFNQFKSIYPNCELKYDFGRFTNFIFVPNEPILLDQYMNIQSLLVFHTDIYGFYFRNLKGIAAFDSNEWSRTHNFYFDK